MRSYEAARGLFSFLGLCSGAVIVIGVIVAIMGGMAANAGFRGQNDIQILLGVAPGAVIALAGFFGLALVQMGRASVDSAEYGQQALDVSRQQLEVSRDLLAQGKTTAASYAELLKRQPAAPKIPVDAPAVSSVGLSYSDRPEPANTGSASHEPAQQIKLDDTAPALVTQDENEPLPINVLTDNSGTEPLEVAANSVSKNGAD